MCSTHLHNAATPDLPCPPPSVSRTLETGSFPSRQDGGRIFSRASDQPGDTRGHFLPADHMAKLTVNKPDSQVPSSSLNSQPG